MAGYPVFQAQGPVIPINLYAENAQAGANIAKSVGNPISSAVTGAIEGYQEGQKIEQNALNIQQTEQQIKDEQTINEINQLKLRIGQQTESDQLAATKAELEAKANLLNRQNEFVDKFKNADPATQANLVLGGQFADLFMQNPKLYQGALSEVRLNPNNGLDQGARDNIAQQLKLHTTNDFYNQLAQRTYPDYIKSQEELRASPLTQALADKIDVPIEDIPKNVNFYPASYYLTDPKTKKLILNPDGSKALNPRYEEVGSTGKYDVFSKDDVLLFSGANDPEGITRDGYKLFNRVNSNTSIISGAQKRLALNQVAKSQTSAETLPANSAQQIETLGTPQPRLPEIIPKLEGSSLEKQDPFRLAVQQTLQLPDDKFNLIDEPVKELRNQVSNYVSYGNERNNPAAIKKIQDTVNTIGRTISDNKYDNSPALQAQFTEGDVARYNEALLKKLTTVQLKQNPVLAAIQGKLPEPENDLYNAMQVTSPKDLYYITQREAIETSLNKLILDMITKRQSQTDAVLNASVSKNKNIDFLNKVAAGKAGGQ